MKRSTHTTIATVLAVFAILAIVVPTASARPPKPGTSQQTKAQCDSLKAAYDISYDNAVDAHDASDWANYEYWLRMRGAYLSNARRLGCDWAKHADLVSQTQTASGPKLNPPILDVR